MKQPLESFSRSEKAEASEPWRKHWIAGTLATGCRTFLWNSWGWILTVSHSVMQSPSEWESTSLIPYPRTALAVENRVEKPTSMSPTL